MSTPPPPSHCEVLVIGGGAAGLAAAVTLARSRRDVVVVDGGEPRNAPADGVHALLGLDGIAPADLLARGRDEVRRYGGRVITGQVVAARLDGGEFAVELADGARVTAARLLITTGLVDELPAIPGLAEQWGHGVVHCPYCHGWEVRDRRIVVVGTGPMSVHQALLFGQLTEDVTLVTHDAEPSADERAQLAAVGIDVLEGPVLAVHSDGGTLTGVELAGGRRLRCDAVVVATRMVARTNFLEPLGLFPVPHPSGMGSHLAVDATGRTEVAGVFAAGNVADLSAQVGAAAAAGTFAAAQLNAELVMERARRALATGA